MDLFNFDFSKTHEEAVRDARQEYETNSYNSEQIDDLELLTSFTDDDDEDNYGEDKTSNYNEQKKEKKKMNVKKLKKSIRKMQKSIKLHDKQIATLNGSTEQLSKDVSFLKKARKVDARTNSLKDALSVEDKTKREAAVLNIFWDDDEI